MRSIRSWSQLHSGLFPARKPPRNATGLLECHRDLEALLGRDQVVVVVLADVDLRPADSAGELAGSGV